MVEIKDVQTKYKAYIETQISVSRMNSFKFAILYQYFMFSELCAHFIAEILNKLYKIILKTLYVNIIQDCIIYV